MFKLKQFAIALAASASIPAQAGVEISEYAPIPASNSITLTILAVMLVVSGLFALRK